MSSDIRRHRITDVHPITREQQTAAASWVIRNARAADVDPRPVLEALFARASVVDRDEYGRTEAQRSRPSSARKARHEAARGAQSAEQGSGGHGDARAADRRTGREEGR